MRICRWPSDVSFGFPEKGQHHPHYLAYEPVGKESPEVKRHSIRNKMQVMRTPS
jgi:hypothetical protein